MERNACIDLRLRLQGEDRLPNRRLGGPRTSLALHSPRFCLDSASVLIGSASLLRHIFRGWEANGLVSRRVWRDGVLQEDDER